MKKAILFILMLPLLLTGCSNLSSGQATNSTQQVSAQTIGQWTYRSNDKPVKIINGDKPTISYKAFEQSHIDFGGLDDLHRTKRATAYLTRNNLGRSYTRTEQTWRPTGWHNQPKYVNGQRVIAQNRGHLIAYTMTFNLNKDGKPDQGQLGSIDNPYNLFTQTEFSNQKTMIEIEQTVRNALARNKKMIYQVTPIFRGQELMARGVWVQGISNDGSVKFNRYLWNVQDQVQFDYATGRSRVNRDFRVPEVKQQHYQSKKYHHNSY